MGLWRWKVLLGDHWVGGWAFRKQEALMKAASAHIRWEGQAD